MGFFIVSWSGLGFLTPLLVFAPLIFGYVFSRLFGNEVSLKHATLWVYGIASIFGPFITYSVGRRWNKHTIAHRFCGWRVEHWGLIQGLMTFLILASIGMLNMQEKVPADSPFISVAFVIYGVFLIGLPIITFIYIKRKNRS